MTLKTTNWLLGLRVKIINCSSMIGNRTHLNWISIRKKNVLWQSIIFSFNFRFTTAVKIVWELSKIQCLTWLFKHPNTLIWSWLPGHPNLIKIPKTAVKNLWEFSNRKRIETCALQKCKVLRDYENAPWQPLWLSSHEFMTAVGTIEDLHIFCLLKADEKGHRNGCASCRQLSAGTTITWEQQFPPEDLPLVGAFSTT